MLSYKRNLLTGRSMFHHHVFTTLSLHPFLALKQRISFVGQNQCEAPQPGAWKTSAGRQTFSSSVIGEFVSCLCACVRCSGLVAVNHHLPALTHLPGRDGITSTIIFCHFIWSLCVAECEQRLAIRQTTLSNVPPRPFVQPAGTQVFVPWEEITFFATSAIHRSLTAAFVHWDVWSSCFFDPPYYF